MFLSEGDGNAGGLAGAFAGGGSLGAGLTQGLGGVGGIGVGLAGGACLGAGALGKGARGARLGGLEGGHIAV